MIKEILHSAEERMGKTIDTLRQDLHKLRTGRAHTSLLDHIEVDYYGSNVPLSQVANVNAENAQTLSIAPYEKTMVAVIEKAIMTSDLGLTPNTAGTTIRVNLPPLTEERRKDLIKVVKQEAEQTRVALRNIRRDALSDMKDMQKEKMISEDEEHKAGENIQKITNRFVSEVDSVLEEKEKELLSF